MSDTDNTQEQERKERDLINDLLNGKGMDFTVDGQQFYIAAPTTEEMDDAKFMQQVAYARAMDYPEMDDLLDVPPSPGTVGSWQNKADQIASNHALLVRDRWLSVRLICNSEGERMFDTDDADSKAEWDKLPIKVKEAARSAIWTMLAVIYTVPFDWESGDALKSD